MPDDRAGGRPRAQRISSARVLKVARRTIERRTLFIVGITHRTRTTPAQALGLSKRKYRLEEVLAWREDWGPLSPALAD